LREVKIKFVGNGSPDERPGIALVFADHTVEENKAERGVLLVKLLDGLDNLPDTLSLLVDSAITKDLEFPARMSVAGNGLSGRLFFREWRRRFRLRQPIKYLRVYSARCSETAHLVFSFYPPADAFGTAEEVIVTPRDILLFFVAFEDEIEKFRPGREALELREDRIFAANPNLEFLGRDRLKRFDLAPEPQPVRLLPFQSEQDKAVASPDERVANLDVTADSAKYFHVGEQGGNFHLRQNVPRASRPVKRP
jgi:hypothetical protein